MQGIPQIFLSLFYLSAQAHLVIEMFTVFTKAYRIDTIQFDKLKYILISWGKSSQYDIVAIQFSMRQQNNRLCLR